jgi:hypothetical protein
MGLYYDTYLVHGSDRLMIATLDPMVEYHAWSRGHVDLAQLEAWLSKRHIVWPYLLVESELVEECTCTLSSPPTVTSRHIGIQ